MPDKKLIKDGNHYVPWDYRFWTDDNGSSAKFEPEYQDDRFASLPSLEYDKEKQKWRCSFHAPDFGGYDVFMCEWYYDTIDDFIKDIKKGIKDE